MSNRNYNRGYAPRGMTGHTDRAYYGQQVSRVRNGRQGGAHQTKDSYVYGSAAPAYAPVREDKRRYRDDRGYRRERAARTAPVFRSFMNPALIVFMTAVVFAVSVVLIQYVGLQAEVTASVKEIARLESSLSELKSNNDELENQIDSSVNLDDVKYKAITKLGMTYAEENQIIEYDGGEGDYVRQVTQLGQ